MNRIAAVAAAVLLAVTLTGCSAATSDATEPQAGAQTSQDAPGASESSAPLVAETPEEQAPTGGDAAFLADVRGNLPEKTTIGHATDAQLVAAGEEACERIAAGESTESMSLIEGETPNVIGTYEDSGAIIVSARKHLCTS
jgi:hypothetical protein